MKGTMNLQLAFLNVFLGIVEGSVIRHTGTSGDTETNNGASDLKEDYSSTINYLIKTWIDKRTAPSQAAETQSLMVEDLRGLYKTLKHHPALMERRLQVGSKIPPTSPPVLLEIDHNMKKRTVFDVGLAVPVCPFTTEWKLLHQAKDINNTVVEVFQPQDDSNRYQWFYTVSCDNSQQEQGVGQPCCRGVDTRRYTSQCIPRKSFVMALIRRPGSLTYDWNYIQVDTSCNCAISRR